MGLNLPDMLVFNIGSSCDESVVVRYPNSVGIISMHGFHDYKAYVFFGDKLDMPPLFPKVCCGNIWCRVYDDNQRVLGLHGDEITGYQLSGKEILFHCTGAAWVDGAFDESCL